MIRDRDRIYGVVITRRLQAMGIRDKPIAPASPWQNGFAERLIGSIRRECLDHILVSGEAHLRRILISYADYYNSAVLIPTDGKAGTVENMWLDEFHGLRISIKGHEGKWPVSTRKFAQS